MTTLIAVYKSDGCVGRCDAKCYDAAGPSCDCICGGRNHGVGRSQAVQNNRELVPDELLAAWAEQHELDRAGLHVLLSESQLELPIGG
jgi:hypothetical protein